MMGLKMSTALVFRALAVVAFVAVSTAVIIKPELIGGAMAPQTHQAVVVLAHG
ncbi:hypothetical protein [Massilia cavernae]|uniref:hypothetical protein n=1 Tax=Massilia cavernae TaxID=2320864 RepID=UPI0016042519|nr:hypothetical protein [Massilia cavernae]